MADEREDKRDFTARDRWLTFAVVVGPWSALMDQLTAYSLEPASCAQGSKLLLHSSSVVFLLIALVGAAIGARHLKAIDHSPSLLADQRARWASLLAVTLSFFGALVIVAMEIPNIILRSCD